MLSHPILSLARSGARFGFRTVLSRMLARGALISIALACTQVAAAQTAPAAQPNQAAQGAPAAPAPQAPPPAAYPTQPAPNAAYPEQPPPAGFQPAPSPLYQQPAPLYQQPPRGGWRPARPSKGLMITGIAILGGSYLVATSVALALLDEDEGDDCRRCDDVAPWLFVPVAGPFIAMSETDDGDWALWFLGMVEVVGTGLMVGGIVRYKRTKSAAEMQGFSSWTLRGGRTLSLDAATSTRMVGPRLKLTF